MSQLKFAMVSGEHSGDKLGASLIRELKETHPNAKFYGIGGPLMRAEGFESLYDMENLTVMGFDDVLLNYFQLKTINHKLISYFSKTKPTVFIGIDSYSFNYTLYKKLKPLGIKTVQYIAPQIWAWRQYRAKTIKKVVDLVLALYPFECPIYEKLNIPIECIGHPFTDQSHLPQNTLKENNLQQTLKKYNKIVAVLPGTRSSDLKYHAELFIDTMLSIQNLYPSIYFIIPLPNQKLKNIFKNILRKKNSQKLNISILIQPSREIIQVADAVLLKSGTSTFETLILKKPMVVAYKMGTLTNFIFKRLVKTPFIAVPNILANNKIVDEYVQKQATPLVLANAILKLLNSPNQNLELIQKYEDIHQKLKRNSTKQAAQAILDLINP